MFSRLWYIATCGPFCKDATPHNKKYHNGIRGIYITNTSTTMVFANEKTRFTTITVPRFFYHSHSKGTTAVIVVLYLYHIS